MKIGEFVPGVLYKIPRTVPQGARVMDTVYPGWYKKINPTTFDMGCPSNCVIGQQNTTGKYVDWTATMKSLFGTCYTNGVFSMYTDMWKKEISKRLKKDIKENWG